MIPTLTRGAVPGAASTGGFGSSSAGMAGPYAQGKRVSILTALNLRYKLAGNANPAVVAEFSRAVAVGWRAPTKPKNEKEQTMKNLSGNEPLTPPAGTRRHPGLLALAALLTTVWTAPAEDGQGEHYRQLNLGSDVAGGATLEATNLV